MRRTGSKRRALIAVACALTIVSGCGSGNASPSAPNSAGASASSVSKHAGVFSSRDTDLTVINRSGRDMTADICHDGYCNGTLTLKQGESVESKGVTITGWVRSGWGYGHGSVMNPFTTESANWATPYQIDFKGFNPDYGLPYLELNLADDCERGIHSLNGKLYSSMAGGSRIEMVEGQVSQTGANLLCSYGMVGSRSADTSDYKVMTLEVYAPLQNTCWEYSPGPVHPPQSPDGSWSCHPQGPRPPSDIPEAPQPK